MFRRLVKLSKNNSFFMLGPRGVGKSTLIKEQLGSSEVHVIDLLLDEAESRYKKIQTY